LAKIYSIIGETESANKYYRKVIELDQKGILANHAKRGIVAIKDTGAGSSEDLETLYAKGYNAFLFSDYLLAAEMYQQYVQRKPEDDYVWSALGSAFLRSGQPERAAQALERAIKIKPAKALYLKQLALALDALNRPHEVIKVLEKARELGKGDSVMLGILGKNLMKLNHLEEAVAPLEQAVKVSKSNLTAQYYLAVALVRLNRIESAVLHLDNVLTAKVNSPLKDEAQRLMAKLRV
jgi:Flp pilus assembly protein TadD